MVGSVGGTLKSTAMSPRDALPSAIVTALCSASASDARSSCSRTGRTKSSISWTMALAIFASLMMSADQRLHLRIVRHLAAQQPGHHFDAGQRILDLVGHRRGHLAERGQPIAQPLALFHLLDVREVLEEERRADGLRRRRRGRARACSRSPCRSDFSRSSARLGSVAISNAPAEHADDVGVVAEHVGVGAGPGSPDPDAARRSGRPRR